MKPFVFINLFLLIFALFGFKSYGQSKTDKPTAFIGISAFIGKHNISFLDFAKSKGYSFGFNLSLGIYLINNTNYHGGLQFSLLEGASYEKNRRQKSEEFNLPNKDYDKHIIFKFSQFRSASIGWFNQIDRNDYALFQLTGFGIFGTTEKDQLLDFGMHNSLGILTNKPDNTRLLLQVLHDIQIGRGNPNYSMSNTAFSFGGFRSFK